MKSKVSLVWFHIVQLLTMLLPDHPIVMRGRGTLLKPFLKKCGKNFQVANGVLIRNLVNLSVGDNVYIGPRSILLIREELIIGDSVLIGPHNIIVDGDHGYDGDSYRWLQGKSAKIEIKKGAWITSNCTLTKGVLISEGELIKPNSCVWVAKGIRKIN